LDSLSFSYNNFEEDD
nr:RecName: Full=Antifungal protein 1; Short=GAFP-1 [Arachis hypogaea]